MLSQITFSTSVGLATEVVCNLLTGSFVRWQNIRHDIPGVNFSSEWGSCCEENTEQFFKRRLRSFSYSIRHFRITRIMLGAVSVPSDPVIDDGDDDSDVKRVILFHLGDNRSMSQVILEVALTDRPKDIGEGINLYSEDRWSVWNLSYKRAIICRVHPDPKFVNYVVLGSDAIDLDAWEDKREKSEI